MESRRLIFFILLCAIVSWQMEAQTKQERDHFQRQIDTMQIQYAYTILYVEDIPQTMKFYQEAFGFKQKLLTPDQDYGEVHSGTTTLAFANIELGNANFPEGFQQSDRDQKPFGVELAFTTEDVEGVIAHALKHGATQLVEAVVKPWGQKVGYVRDINGFIIEICTPIPSE
ncbi:MAG: VOC family protein [Bacteroidota bacterium]